jgi:hypothetical protein
MNSTTLKEVTVKERRRSLDYQHNKLTIAINYKNSIFRPNYTTLTNTVQYTNQFTLETGNPFLKPAIHNNIAILVNWKNLHANANLNLNKNDIE